LEWSKGTVLSTFEHWSTENEGNRPMDELYQITWAIFELITMVCIFIILFDFIITVRCGKPIVDVKNTFNFFIATNNLLIIYVILNSKILTKAEMIFPLIITFIQTFALLAPMFSKFAIYIYEINKKNNIKKEEKWKDNEIIFLEIQEKIRIKNLQELKKRLLIRQKRMRR
jgi:hypothetical protein